MKDRFLLKLQLGLHETEKLKNECVNQGTNTKMNEINTLLSNN